MDKAMKNSKGSKVINGTPVSFPLKKCVLAGMIIFSILINALVPRFALSQEDFGVLSKIMQQQSTLLRFFSLSSIPLNIVNEIFCESQNVKSDVKTSLPGQKKESKTNSCSEFSFISFGTTLNLTKLNTQGSEGSGGSIFGISGFSRNYLTGDLINFSPHLFIFVSFLLFFFLLPRSSVNDNYASINYKNHSTQLGFPSWVFLLPNYQFLGRMYYESN
ncbi:MAG: hypothetical protein NT145_06910 [Elusimicrobia bacterium]|nr:hypothetical protein [Elusimicrobiota bacterium]